MTTQARPFRPESSLRSATNPLDAIAPSTRARRSGPDSARCSIAKSSATFFNGEPFPQGYVFEQGQPISGLPGNPDDHAIVVGIAHYPGLLNEEGQPSDLDGPVTDAASMRDWLLAED
ncbi:MAG: hypothetical protein WA970_13655, partial [Gammaproteobacteria bacterium]